MDYINIDEFYAAVDAVDQNQRAMFTQMITDAKLPSYDITLSVNFWLEESSRAMGFVRETSEEHQPEGVDVFKMPAYGYKMAENGAQELEVFDVSGHSTGYAYVPVEKCQD